LGIILAEHPAKVVQPHVVSKVAKGDAVFRLFVDFLLWVIGPQVALAAVLRLPGPSRREVVPRVAG
jgi:hypothetical protein